MSLNLLKLAASEAVYLLGVYKVASSVQDHLPISPKAVIISIVAIQAITCVSSALLAMIDRNLNKTRENLNRAHNLSSRTILKKQFDQLKIYSEGIYKVIVVTQPLVLGLGVFSSFISPVGAIAVAGIESLTRAIYNDFLGFPNPAPQIYNELVPDS